MFVDSGNPANTVTDTTAVETALSSLDLLVVVEVAMPEPEIYVRLLRAMGFMPADDTLEHLRDLARADRPAFSAAFSDLLKDAPHDR